VNRKALYPQGHLSYRILNVLMVQQLKANQWHPDPRNGESSVASIKSQGMQNCCSRNPEDLTMQHMNLDQEGWVLIDA